MAALIPDWYAVRALSSAVSPTRSLSARITSSKKIASAISNSEPIGKDRNLGPLIVRHSLRRDDRPDIGLLRGPTSGWAVMMAVRAPASLAMARKVSAVGSQPWPAVTIEEVALANRGRGHVGDDMRVPTHMEQAHRKAAQRQALAAGAVEADAAARREWPR